MSLDVYGTNMKKYVDLLPKTDVLVVYFVEKKTVQPHIVEDIRIFKKDTLIRTSESGKWTMVYPHSSLRCFIARVDSDVKYVSTNKSWVDAFQEVGEQNGGMECQLGDHLTFGFEKYGTMLILNTHTTRYTEKPGEYGAFLIDKPIECRVPLLHPISHNTVCYTKKAVRTKHKFMDEYQKEPELVKTIQFLKQVCMGEIQLVSGPRGGAYIQKDGRKQYIKRLHRTLHGGVSQDQQEIIDMVYDQIVKHVVEVYERNSLLGLDASMIYDTTNYFEVQRPVLVLLYESKEAERCAIFHLDLEQVQLALQYEKQLARDRQPRGKKWRSWKQFQKHRDVHIQMVLAM